MLRIENRSDQKQRTCSAAAAGGVKLHCVSRKIILNNYLQLVSADSYYIGTSMGVCHSRCRCAQSLSPMPLFNLAPKDIANGQKVS